MDKRLLCGDVIPGCQFKAHADSEPALLEKVAAHVAEVHGVTNISPEVLAQVKGAIRESPWVQA